MCQSTMVHNMETERNSHTLRAPFFSAKQRKDQMTHPNESEHRRVPSRKNKTTTKKETRCFCFFVFCCHHFDCIICAASRAAGIICDSSHCCFNTARRLCLSFFHLISPHHRPLLGQHSRRESVAVKMIMAMEWERFEN